MMNSEAGPARVPCKALELWADDDDHENKLPNIETCFRISNSELKNMIENQVAGSRSKDRSLDFAIGCSSSLVSASPPFQPILGSLPAAQNAQSYSNLVTSNRSSSSESVSGDSLTSGSDTVGDGIDRLSEGILGSQGDSAGAHCNVELPVVDDITISPRSAIDFFDIHEPQDTTARWAPGWPNQYWDLDLNDWNLLTRAEPPVVSSKEIFDMGSGVKPIYSGPAASVDETSINEDIQKENTTPKTRTGSSTPSNGKAYHKKFHYRNRGQNKNPQWKQPGIPNLPDI